MANALKNAMRTVEQEKKKKPSEKRPQFYNAQIRKHVNAMVDHPEVIVRVAACSNENLPQNIIKNALKTEQNPQVLEAILLNPRLPEKEVIAFTDDSRAGFIDDDLAERLVARVKNTALGG